MTWITEISNVLFLIALALLLLFLIALALLLFLFFFTIGAPVISNIIAKLYYDSAQVSLRGNPFTFEESQYLCDGGIYPDLEEFQYFYKTSSFFGDRILSKKTYHIEQIRKSTAFINNVEYYCLGVIK